MTYDLIEQAEHSIHYVHELILRVFTDADGAGAASIEPLMQAFAEDFSMVGISGDALTRVEVEQLFKGAVGAKAGLDIEISDLHTVWQEDDMLAVSYVETQRLDGAQHSRVAVAILSGQPEGVKWVYLHEAPLSGQV